MVVGEGLQEEVVGLALGRVPFDTVDFEECQVFGVVDDRVELFAADLNIRAVARRDGGFAHDVERDGVDGVGYRVQRDEIWRDKRDV